MTPLQMKYFNSVCCFQSISKASAILHVTQPTISVAIQSLEKELNISLFYRNGKHLLLTKEGSIIWEKVAAILANIEQIEKEIQDIAHNKNHIKLAIPLQIGVQLLPKLYGEFKRNYPEIDLEIYETGGIDALQLIERDEIDLAITNYDNNFSENLRYQKIGENEICFCTSPKNSLAAKAAITMEDVTNEALVMLSGGFFINRSINSLFQKANITPKVLLYSSQLHTIKNMVKHNLASTFLMRQAVTSDDNIKVIPLKPSYFINSGIVTKKDKPLYSDERTLIAFLKASYGKQVERQSKN